METSLDHDAVDHDAVDHVTLASPPIDATASDDAAPVQDASRGRVVADAAEIYDRDFVPALFAPWAEPMLDAVGVAAGDRVLDIGCGTGVLTRAAAIRVGASGSVVGVDPNPAMLAVAERRGGDVDWRRGTAEALPVDDGSVDVAVSQFALMFFDDAAMAAREIRRVLRPAGRMAIATWAGIDRNPGFLALHELFSDVLGADIASGLLAPFSIPTPDDLARLLADAFPDVEVDELERDARFPSIDAWVRTEVRAWTLAEHVDEAAEDHLVAEAQQRCRHLLDPDGSVRFTSPALIASARRSR